MGLTERTIAGVYRQKTVTVTDTPQTALAILKAMVAAETFSWGEQSPSYCYELVLLGDGSGNVKYQTVLDGDAVAHAPGSEKSFAIENALSQIELSVASGTETITLGMLF